MLLYFFFFNDTATTEIYTLSLHDALPISMEDAGLAPGAGDPTRLGVVLGVNPLAWDLASGLDRKSTRLNSSHSQISYAVFCLKKKNQYSRGAKQNNKIEHRKRCAAIDSAS